MITAYNDRKIEAHSDFFIQDINKFSPYLNFELSVETSLTKRFFVSARRNASESGRVPKYATDRTSIATQR